MLVMSVLVNYPLPTHSVCEDTVVDVCVSYPSPTRSVCKDTLNISWCMCVCVLALNR